MMSQFEFNVLYEEDFIENPTPKLLEAQKNHPVLRLNPGLEETFHFLAGRIFVWVRLDKEFSNWQYADSQTR